MQGSEWYWEWKRTSAGTDSLQRILIKMQWHCLKHRQQQKWLEEQFHNTHSQWSEKVITMISKHTLQPSAVTVLGYMVTGQGLTAIHGLTSSPLKMSAKNNVCIYRALPQHLYKKTKMLQPGQGKKESEWSSELNISRLKEKDAEEGKHSACAEWLSRGMSNPIPLWEPLASAQ